MKSNLTKQVNSIKALDFLNNHPAFSTPYGRDSLFEGLELDIVKCCKRNYSESYKDIFSVSRESDLFENVKDKFKEGQDYIYCKYEDVFGEKWKFDHVEYWYETAFHIFKGDPYVETDSYEMKNWDRYCAINESANSFEDFLIKCAAETKSLFGKFSIETDFLTKEEIENHNDNFSLIRGKKTKMGTEMLRNPVYVPVTQGLQNLRWLKWFIETDYCKKNWNEELNFFKKLVKKLDNEPVKRKKLLKKT